MSSDEFEGKVNNGLGKLEAATGEILDDPLMQAEGEVRQFAGSVQEAVGVAAETVKRTAARAKTVVADATDQVTDTYQDIRDKAQSVADTVDPFVKGQPYLTAALAALGGLILGALLFGGGAKVIYIRPAKS